MSSIIHVGTFKLEEGLKKIVTVKAGREERKRIESTERKRIESIERKSELSSLMSCENGSFSNGNILYILYYIIYYVNLFTLSLIINQFPFIPCFMFIHGEYF